MNDRIPVVKPYVWQFRVCKEYLRQEPIRCKPWSCRTFLNILAKTNVDGVVVFCYIPIDVVQPAVADLDVDLGAKEHTQELHERGYQ